MRYSDIKSYLEELSQAYPKDNIWLDAEVFEWENSENTPGAMISKYGYYVIGVTVGGNAITVCDHDDGIRYCDHTGWYEVDMCWAAKEDYDERPYSPENVNRAQVVLAETRSEFLNTIRKGGIYALVDKYD